MKVKIINVGNAHPWVWYREMENQVISAYEHDHEYFITPFRDPNTGTGKFRLIAKTMCEVVE